MTLLWKPLLSATLPMDLETGDFDWTKVVFPCYASPKIDGFRAMVQRGVLVSRNGLAVKNKELQTRYGRREHEGLDGELVDGPPTAAAVFHRTSRVVKKADASAAVTTFNVIDYYEDGPRARLLKIRIDKLEAAAFDRKMSDFAIITQTLIKNIDQLKAFEAKQLKAGYEGVMLRRADQGPYPQKPGKENRSTLNEFYLCRMKRFEFDEAVIVGFRPLEHNLNEERTATGARSSKKAGIIVDKTRIGSVTLRAIKTGAVFDTTVGAERLRTWKGWPSAIGKVVRYRYQLCGTFEKPRINSCSFDELGVGK